MVVHQLQLQLCTPLAHADIVVFLVVVLILARPQTALGIDDAQVHALDGVHRRRLAQHTQHRLAVSTRSRPLN